MGYSLERTAVGAAQRMLVTKGELYYTNCAVGESGGSETDE